MENFWKAITNFMNFTGVSDITVWQDIALGVIFIPLSIEVARLVFQFLNSRKPIQLLLSEFVHAKEQLLISYRNCLLWMIKVEL